MDLATLIKPMLTAGELRVIGSTTFDGTRIDGRSRADQAFTPAGELADPELQRRLADLLEALANVREADERVEPRDRTPALRAG